jgi:hypothetical protein
VGGWVGWRQGKGSGGTLRRLVRQATAVAPVAHPSTQSQHLSRPDAAQPSSGASGQCSAGPKTSQSQPPFPCPPASSASKTLSSKGSGDFCAMAALMDWLIRTVSDSRLHSMTTAWPGTAQHTARYTGMPVCWSAS